MKLLHNNVLKCLFKAVVEKCRSIFNHKTQELRFPSDSFLHTLSPAFNLKQSNKVKLNMRENNLFSFIALKHCSILLFTFLIYFTVCAGEKNLCYKMILTHDQEKKKPKHTPSVVQWSQVLVETDNVQHNTPPSSTTVLQTIKIWPICFVLTQQQMCFFCTFYKSK